MHISLNFNPLDCGCAKTKEIFENDTAKTLYLLWRRSHIVDQFFPQQVLNQAKRIERKKPQTYTELAACFMLGTNFTRTDIERFCTTFSLDYFIGAATVDYIYEVPQDGNLR